MPDETSVVDVQESITPELTETPSPETQPAGSVEGPQAPSETEPQTNLEEGLVSVDDLSLNQLRTYFQRHPELQKLDTEDKAFHNFLHATVRRSAQLEDFRKIFATADSANEALHAANELIDFEGDFYDTKSGGPQRTLQRLYEKSLVRNADGSFAVDGQGRVQSSGAFEALITQIRTDLWAQTESFLKSKNDGPGIEALNYIRSLYGDGPRRVAQSSDGTQAPEERLTPDERRKLDEHSQLVQENERNRRAGEQAYEDRLRQDMDDGVLVDAGKFMKDIVTRHKVAITPKMQDLLVRSAVGELAQKALQDPAYRTLLTTLMRRPRSEATRQEIVRQVRQYANRHLPSLVAAQLQEATGTVIAGYAAKQKKIQGQKEQAHIKTSGSAPSPGSSSVEERLQERSASAKRRLTDREVLDAVTEDE